MSSIQEKKPRKKPTAKLVNPLMAAEAAVEPSAEPKEKNVIVIPKKKEKEEAEICSICANHYTPVIRRKIVCKYCSHDICCKCVEQYLLTRHDDAHCMHCRVNYSDAVLREICTKTYLRQSFFQHRQEVLVNRNRAQLPGLQDEALLERKRRERMAARAELLQESSKIRDEKRELQVEYDKIMHEWVKLRIIDAHTAEEKEEVRAQKTELRRQMDENRDKQIHKLQLLKEIQRAITRLYILNDNPDLEENEEEIDVVAAAEEKKKEEEKKRFIRRCIRDGCQGFLSQAWKCGMCEWYSCSKCFGIKGPEHDSPHECTTDALETAALIRKNCKPCPKCGEQIEHGGGCSQMWCISCQTPWDWDTGKIVTSGPIHNPLYYEWQRRTGGVAPRNPGDIPCGGYPRNYELVRFPMNASILIDTTPFYEFYRICQELRTITRSNYQSHINDQNTNQIHVRFLLNDFDEKKWGRQLAQLEKRKKCHAEIQEVFAAFHMVGVDLVNRIQYYRDGAQTIVNMTPNEVKTLMGPWKTEVFALIDMINQALQTISISYCYTVPYIQSTIDTYHRLVLLVRYRNFSHDMKKRRVKKDTSTDNGTGTEEEEEEEQPEEVEEVEEMVEEAAAVEEVEEMVEEVEIVEDESDGYDSDRSTSSDVQAAIAASLQDA